MQNGTRVFVLVRLYFVWFRVIYVIYNQMCEFIIFFSVWGGGGGGVGYILIQFTKILNNPLTFLFPASLHTHTHTQYYILQYLYCMSDWPQSNMTNNKRSFTYFTDYSCRLIGVCSFFLHLLFCLCWCRKIMTEAYIHTLTILSEISWIHSSLADDIRHLKIWYHKFTWEWNHLLNWLNV